jgi:hypothetical protein
VAAHPAAQRTGELVLRGASVVDRTYSRVKREFDHQVDRIAALPPVHHVLTNPRVQRVTYAIAGPPLRAAIVAGSFGAGSRVALLDGHHIAASAALGAAGTAVSAMHMLHRPHGVHDHDSRRQRVTRYAGRVVNVMASGVSIVLGPLPKAIITAIRLGPLGHGAAREHGHLRAQRADQDQPAEAQPTEAQPTEAQPTHAPTPGSDAAEAHAAEAPAADTERTEEQATDH